MMPWYNTAIVSTGAEEAEQAIERIKEAVTGWLWAEGQKTAFKLSKRELQESIVVAVWMGELAVDL